VTHSLEEAQVVRISNALQNSAEAIQGINQQFDAIDQHWKDVQFMQNEFNSRLEITLESVQRLDKTMTDRIDKSLDTLHSFTNELNKVLDSGAKKLREYDMRRELNQLPKAAVPIIIPLIILMCELAVANAYIGILLLRLPEINFLYSRYLVSNAAMVLLGLTLSLFWLVLYRGWLSYKSYKYRTRLNQRDFSMQDPNAHIPQEARFQEEFDEVDKDEPPRADGHEAEPIQLQSTTIVGATRNELDRREQAASAASNGCIGSAASEPNRRRSAEDEWRMFEHREHVASAASSGHVGSPTSDPNRRRSAEDGLRQRTSTHSLCGVEGGRSRVFKDDEDGSHLPTTLSSMLRRRGQAGREVGSRTYASRTPTSRGSSPAQTPVQAHAEPLHLPRGAPGSIISVDPEADLSSLGAGGGLAGGSSLPRSPKGYGGGQKLQLSFGNPFQGAPLECTWLDTGGHQRPHNLRQLPPAPIEHPMLAPEEAEAGANDASAASAADPQLTALRC